MRQPPEVADSPATPTTGRALWPSFATMSRSLCLIPAAAVSSIALSACGGHTLTHASAATDNLAAWHAAVACARRHGMPDIPDPVIGAGGHVRMPGGTPQPTPAVLSACASQIRAIETFLPRPAAPDIAVLVQAANCMRAHGNPSWPDPNSQGVFHVKSAVAGTPARLGRALRACRSQFPGGWRLDITPGGQ